jgi:acyl-coenzyme A thioesterase PaaI-like protein
MEIKRARYVEDVPALRAELAALRKQVAAQAAPVATAPLSSAAHDAVLDGHDAVLDAAVARVASALDVRLAELPRRGLNGWNEPANPYHMMKTTLMGDGMIEGWRVLGNLGDAARNTCVVVTRIGQLLNGWDGIVHGGFTSSLFDQVFGHHFCNPLLLGKVGFTANLKVDFLKPFPHNTTVVVVSKLENVERRKYLFSGSVHVYSPDGGDVLGLEVARASCLYIIARQDAAPTYRGGAPGGAGCS